MYLSINVEIFLKKAFWFTLLGISSVRMMKGSEWIPIDAKKIPRDKIITGTHGN